MDIIKSILILILTALINSNIYSKNIYVKNSTELSDILKNCKENETIILKSGIYKGNFVVNKSINLYSNEHAILTSGNKGSILTIKSSSVKIKGIHFYNSGKNTFDKESCILIQGCKTYIIKNYFSECGFGIWSDSGSYNNISNNLFIGTTNIILSDRGNTIHLYKNNNTIVSKNFVINGRDGIYISNSKEVSINKNMFINTRFGIHYMFSNKCNVISNIITDSLIGIAVMYSKYVDLINNIVYSNKDHGLFFRDVLYSRVLKNKSLYNTDGLLFGNSYFNDIINNDVIKNSIGIKIYSGSDENLVYDNNFINNRLQVQFLDNKKLIWNSKNIGNFWSHYIGWNINMGKIGDKKFYVSNINDWLIFSYPILRVMFNSPALTLLQKIENQFPAFRKYSIIDNYPLMRPTTW